MNVSHTRSRLVFPLLALLLAFGLLSSCGSPNTNVTNDNSTPEQKTDAKGELVRALRGANVTGFEFESKEDDAQITTSLTNSNVKNVIRIEPSTNNVVLSYASVKDKAKNTTTIYKTEVTRSGKNLSLVVSDFASGAVVSKDDFPPPRPHTQPTFDSLEDCINDFNCKHRGELLCEANRTCKDQFAALTCCLKNGQCFSVHLIIRPTRPICQLRSLVVNFEALVLSQ